MLAVLAAAASVVAIGLGRMGSGARQRAAVEGILAALGGARLDAMRSQSRVRVELSAGEESGSIRLAQGDQERWWHRTMLAPALGAMESPASEGGVRRDVSTQIVDEWKNKGRAAALSVTFDAAGRADRTAWLLAQDERSEGSGVVSAASPLKPGSNGTPKDAFVPSVGSAVGRTLWIVRFDVVAGTPSAERIKAP